MRKGRSPTRASGPFLCLLLLSCGNSTAPSAEDSRRLDNAERMLNAAPAELSNIDAGELGAAEESGSAPTD